MSKIEVNTVEPQCGTTLTLGGSGDTVQLGSGASQTGFGRTGTVDWETTPKTATFTAENGKGYFCNTTAGTFELDLPAGSAGAIVSLQDYNNTFDTYNLTVDPNGSEKINGGDAGVSVVLSTEGLGITFVYVDSTVGWRSIQSNEYSTPGVNPAYVAASGGDSTLTNGDYKTHVFIGPGTFTVSCAGNPFGSSTVDYFVLAGGASGGAPHHNGAGAGGGGAGGFRLSNSAGGIPAPTMSPLVAPAGLPVSATTYPITVGGGGAGVASPPSTYQSGTNGIDSVFSSITSAGGGAGSGGNSTSNPAGNGGSGGGSGYNVNPACTGLGNTPSVSPPQGRNGGSNDPGTSGPYAAAGGGGAGAEGDPSPGPAVGGDGGAGSFIADSIFGPTAPSYGTPGPVSSTRYFGGGGGGGGGITSPYGPSVTGGGAGAGGGGTGGGQPAPTRTGTAGAINTGGGSGGASSNYSPPGTGSSLAGGSGIVVIRYKFQ